jgi:nucleoid-associated protein YgaU
MNTSTSKIAAFARALVLLALVAVIAPWMLIAAARARFDGPAPWSAMPPLGEWSLSSIGGALTDRLSESTIADIVIRVGLTVAWVAIVVLVVTVVAEVVHMLRHGGLAMPDVRGFGMSQSLARVIAAGLLVVVPMLGSPSRATALDAPLLTPQGRAPAAQRIAQPDNPWIADEPGADPLIAPSAASAPSTSPRAGDGRAIPAEAPANPARAAPPPSVYEVRPGDSVWSIAQRIVGDDQRAVAAYADQVLDLNLGTRMPDGQMFSNAAYIEVGWVLQLPGGAVTDIVGVAASPVTHVVEAGETLWSIADDELGDGARWPEIYDANQGRTFDDGRRLTDPNLIVPGWDLDLPTDDVAPVETALEETPVSQAAPAPDVDTPAPDAPDEGNEASHPTVQDVPVQDVPVQDVAVERGAESLDDRPDNAWLTERDAGGAATAGARPDVEAPTADDTARASDPPAASADPLVPSNAGQRQGEASSGGPIDASEQGVQLLTMERAAMLSAGVLTLLAVRRRSRMRRARPNTRLPDPPVHVIAAERSLRSIDAGDRFARVDIAIRNATMRLVAAGARVEAVTVALDGDIELIASRSVDLTAPWGLVAGHDGERWRLPAGTPIELLADEARRVGAPCPTLVQLGRDERDRDVYVDLEALEAIEVGGPGDQADAIVHAIAATLAASVLAEVTTLVGVGVDDDAFLGHRLHRPVRDVQRAFEAAADAIGSTAFAGRSTFELRARVTSGETWEPAVVLAGSAVGTVTPPSDRTGLAVVSSSPIHGPSSRLAPEAEGWVLRPLGLRLTPVGLSRQVVATLAELAAVPEPIGRPEPVEHPGVGGRPSGVLDIDRTMAPHEFDRDDMDDEMDESGPVGPPDDDAPPHDFDGDDGTEVGLSDVRTELAVAPSVAGGAGDELPAGTMQRSDADGSTGAAGVGDQPGPVVAEPPTHALVVRLFGPVTVESADGRPVEFERSKTRELIAWLATHRSRATRSNARAALWELDVRDATFANVVSEARRSLARCVEPPEGEEWVGRTMSDALPLHVRVVTDLDLVERALSTARLQPPDLAIETLRSSLPWIRGMPFEGTSYLWPDAEGISSELVLRAITLTNALADHCLSVGDIDGVFEATSRGLQVLPAHEDMIAVRMRAYAQIGDRAGVRHEWESYERAIVGDPWSDGEPSERMLDLRRELLA